MTGLEADSQLSFFEMAALRVKRRRKRDPLFDAWVEAWGAPQTRDERNRLNAALRQLREIGATPAQVTLVLRRYDREFSGCTRSPQGVTGNWSLLCKPSSFYRDVSRRGESLADTCSHGVSFFERCEECVDA